MEKQTFTILLEDLYNIYNPPAKEHIPELVDKYNRLEFDAVKSIFIKYNHKRQPFYDPEVGSDDFVIKLIYDYAAGMRTMQNYKLKNIDDKKREEQNNAMQEIQKTQQQFKENINNELSKNLKGIQEIISSEINERLSQLPPPIEIKIIDKVTDLELQIENKNMFISAGIGARIITKDNQGKLTGLEISDIMCDMVSYDKPIMEVIVTKL